ncbi:MULTISPECIES: ABC transporter ATP-binding protein [unclassified Gordonia (in: high G+C Gram-positive bacteria)]|uniref:ABC transporter ATP-binding protein n=1 Tax=unclassified Gordonia (in: high G+C Gram-positive bacteria) TaxID=2657482 RepID=UPI001F0F82A7|nr:ATP-binding cassette domain-containing protein [Gordonia sp. ABSL49_1]MCH5644011.1 ATP-binding cassette domain-containing protein [Gordonia sp. ABSL49_1]
MIEIDRLTVRLGGQTVLDEVSATVRPGELVYLLGRNGAGKSTLLRTVSGITRPDGGTARVNGRYLARQCRPLTEVGIHLGADAHHPGHTARRHLHGLADAGGVDRRRADELLDKVGLAESATRRVSDFSLGMTQRLGLAAALLGDAPTILLDEPVNGLDIDGIRWLRNLLRELTAEGRCLLTASHLMDEVARTGDRVIVLDRGRIIADAGVDDFVVGHASLEDAYVAAVGGTTHGH